MLANCFLKIIICSIASFFVCILGVLIAYFTQGSEIANSLFQSYVFHFDGILIVGFGYGLLWFIRSNGEQVFNSLFTILDIPETQQLVLLKYHRWITSSKRKHLVSIIVTIIGGAILWNCGYPLQGFSKYFLAATSISLFYAAGMMSGYFIACILIFRKLDEFNSEVKIKTGASPFELDNINTSLLVCSTLGIVSLYLAFRGTITANYLYTNNEFIFRKLLIYPIAAFLPGILFTAFYCRYVLRKLQENETLQKIESLEKLFTQGISTSQTTKERLEIEKLFIEIKDKLLSERKAMPFLSLKDYPALFISIVFLIDFALKNDTQVQAFFKGIFK